jgi:hypothetical protein
MIMTYTVLCVGSQSISIPTCASIVAYCALYFSYQPSPNRCDALTHSDQFVQHRRVMLRLAVCSAASPHSDMPTPRPQMTFVLMPRSRSRPPPHPTPILARARNNLYSTKKSKKEQKEKPKRYKMTRVGFEPDVVRTCHEGKVVKIVTYPRTFL